MMNGNPVIEVGGVFEAQTLSNFFRFPMIFFCGLFVPVSRFRSGSVRFRTCCR